MVAVSEGTTIIKKDNQSWISLHKNPAMQKRTKHIDVKYYIARERVEGDQLKSSFALQTL